MLVQIVTGSALFYVANAQNASSLAANKTFEGEVEQTYFIQNSAFGILSNELPAQTLDLPVGTCNDQTPCVNGACCSIVTFTTHCLTCVMLT